MRPGGGDEFEVKSLIRRLETDLLGKARIIGDI